MRQTLTIGEEERMGDETSSYLVYNARLRGRREYSEADIASFSVQAWYQTQEIEKQLNKHKCGVERALLFHGRELLHRCITSCQYLNEADFLAASEC